jgi:tRNA G18 (ribose-2'-O)-methylase SpoU
MGAVFSLPWSRVATWPEGLEQLKANGWLLAALTPREDAISMDALPIATNTKLALILGAEGEGISGAAQAVADYRVRIPMAAGIDSLNVAAAAAVAFYATR